MAIDRVRVNERSTKVIEFDILDQAGAAVPAASLSAATLTLVDLDTYVQGSPSEGIINARDAHNVLNANQVTISAAGHVVWTMQPGDNPIVTSRRQIERHRAMFRFT